MTDDVERPDLGDLDWGPSDREVSLSQVFGHAVRLGRNAEEWYARKRPSKRRWGRALRVVAILQGGVAAVLPILSEIIGKDDGASVPPGWAAVALAAAATGVTLDHFFGFTAAWSRYMATGLQLTRLRHDFEYA